MEVYILIAVLLVFAFGVLLFKLPAGVSLMLASVTGALMAGEGIPLRHLIEGSFGFLEAIMIIATAMIYMKALSATGVLPTISYGMIRYLYRYPVVLMIVIMLFIMFPGMLTGLSSACILTTGALVLPALLAMGMDKRTAGSMVAMGAVLGEVAPPISIPVMIIGGGVDMPYIGFTGPLLIATMPLAVIYAVYFRYRHLKDFNVEEVLERLEKPVYSEYGFRLFVPIILVIGYMTAEILFPVVIPHIGVPLVFIIGTITAVGSGRKFKFIEISRSALRDAMPVMSILVGVGMFLQVLTLTGVRGMVAVSALQLPEEIKYLIALIMPFFGSAYASASVIGVPLVYVFIGKNSIVVTAALALLAALGDLMPPPSLLCAYAGQMVGEKNHFSILRKSIPLIILGLAAAILMIIFAAEIGSFLGL